MDQCESLLLSRCCSASVSVSETFQSNFSQRKTINVVFMIWSDSRLVDEDTAGLFQLDNLKDFLEGTLLDVSDETCSGLVIDSESRLAGDEGQREKVDG